jgi:hypothetical protein
MTLFNKILPQIDAAWRRRKRAFPRLPAGGEGTTGGTAGFHPAQIERLHDRHPAAVRTGRNGDLVPDTPGPRPHPGDPPLVRRRAGSTERAFHAPPDVLSLGGAHLFHGHPESPPPNGGSSPSRGKDDSPPSQSAGLEHRRARSGRRAMSAVDEMPTVQDDWARQHDLGADVLGRFAVGVSFELI